MSRKDPAPARFQGYPPRKLWNAARSRSFFGPAICWFADEHPPQLISEIHIIHREDFADVGEWVVKSKASLLIGLFIKCYDRQGSNPNGLEWGEVMDQRESARKASALPHAGESNQKRNLRLVEARNPADRADRARRKLPVSMALVDPKPLTRRSIADLLARAFPEYPLVSASTCEELLDIAEERIGRPNLVVVYVRSAGLTDTSVHSALELLRTRLPDVPAVVLSDRDNVEEVNWALTHGMRGYIPTSVESEIAVAALRLIGAGGTFVPADALRPSTGKHGRRAEGEHRARSHGLDLTPRELSVVDLLREGKPNKLIAAQLEMQESTVKVHVRNILKKLHAANRTHAATVANRLFSQEAK